MLGSHTYYTTTANLVSPSVTLNELGTTTTTYVGGVPIQITTNMLTTPPPLPTVALSAQRSVIRRSSLKARPINGTRVSAITNVLVATFSVANPLATASDYNLPTILWGNGASTTATAILPLSNTPNGVVFGVYGTLSGGLLFYGATGTYRTSVAIVSKAGSKATAAGQAVIATSVPLVTVGPTLVPIAGTPTGLQVVATFTDTTNPLPTSSYSTRWTGATARRSVGRRLSSFLGAHSTFRQGTSSPRPALTPAVWSSIERRSHRYRHVADFQRVELGCDRE